MNATQRIEAAAAEYLVEEGAFESKAAQKRAIDQLNRAYEALRNVDGDEFRAATAATMEAEGHGDAWWFAQMNTRDLPFSLHQYRAAKHAAMWSDADRAALVEHLAALRAEYRAAAILPPTASATAALIKQERAAAAATKDDGFRIVDVSTQHAFCQNQHGTQWLRCDWYRNGRVSFAEIAAHVADCRARWEDAGRPNMSDWDADTIRTFYA